jgi:tetratricopeptide (TPR) repeat protein
MITVITMRSALALALAALLSCAVTARADAPLEPDTSEARMRFTRGVKLYHEGSYDAALAEFTKAYRLAPNYRVLYNLAQVQAERQAGRQRDRAGTPRESS